MKSGPTYKPTACPFAQIPTGRRARTANARSGRPLSVRVVGSQRNRAPSSRAPGERPARQRRFHRRPAVPAACLLFILPSASPQAAPPPSCCFRRARVARAWVRAAAKQHRTTLPPRVARASRWPTASLPSPAGPSR